MKEDANQLVKRCPECQKHGNIHRVPAVPMEAIYVTCPFDQWGIDIVGPFPPAKGQKKFLIVAVEYFTKWVEAEAVARITEEKLKEFVWQNIACRFGIPRILTSDNGTQFSGKKFRGWCQELKIHQNFTSVAYPQSNGQTEVTNRTLVEHLEKRLGGAKHMWVEELHGVLWAYRTTPRVSTGQTPYSLTFGSEAVIPAEVGMPTHRIQTYDPFLNGEARELDLILLEEQREQALVQNEKYKAAMVRNFNRHLKPRMLVQGDLVLRKAESTRHVGKLEPKWDGPFQVAEVIRAGTYRLSTLEGKAIPRTWNIINLKKYYV